MLGDIEAFFALADRAKRFFSRRSQSESDGSVAARFVQLFQAHGVHRNQIPRFFGHDLTLAKVKDDDALLSTLTEEMLTNAAELFAVRREWLDGASSQIYELNHFYKEPQRFAQFINAIIKRANQLGGQLFVEDSRRKSGYADSLLVLEESIGFVGEKVIYRFHLCDFRSFSYWKTRAYLTACIAYAWENDFYIHGGNLETKKISPLLEGEAFIDVSEFGGGISHQGQRWDPEYMALDPEVYLRGIDEGHIGKVLALEKWLELEKEGWMRCGLGDGGRLAIEQKLDQLKSVAVVS
ncbi:hypothetical protein [Microbulbifer sp. ALW1]|uniref:hypothetical protein n=1 Tax=Microbulbifer sp. (strain ALW1) TaxID=1516059 RepID=UPI0013572207|nr:hypothetical protein [Microbulbifer sp. ALW1]